MIEIIAGTDRPNSNTAALARYLESLYVEQKTEARILSLCDLQLSDVQGGGYFGGAKGSFKNLVDRVGQAAGLVLVVPEYNGSYPGILKLFIDYWKYPESFENRPVAFVGLGFRWGGLRPVEHLQQVFGYRNAFVFPNRVFITNIKDALKDGRPVDPMTEDLLKNQTRDFVRFIAGLKSQKLDALSRSSP
jgi:NAD(P)H-dependent FMN reductase